MRIQFVRDGLLLADFSRSFGLGDDKHNVAWRWRRFKA
jgi:hypothetical protein